MTLELTPVERELTLNVLKGRLGELRQEIHHSTVSTFTDQLKDAQRVLTGIIDKLQSMAPAGEGR